MKERKRTQNLNPDTVLKNYWHDNEQFADLFNAVLFDGKQIIQAEELEEVDTEESTVLENKDYAESIKASRDIVKIHKKSSAYETQFVLLGLENQEHIHYAMPIRVMGYDYSAYKKQYDSNAKKYKIEKGLTEDEFLSKMRKEDKFTPIITIVVYYGEKNWDGAKSLHEMLKIPSEMKPYVNDYKLILIEAGKSDLRFHNLNNRDFFGLLKIMLDRSSTLKENKNKAIAYVKDHEVDEAVVMTVASVANRRLDYPALERKGEIDMYAVFEETRMEGKMEGRAEEIVKMGIEFGLSSEDIVERLQKKLNISKQKAKAYLEQFSE